MHYESRKSRTWCHRNGVTEMVKKVVNNIVVFIDDRIAGDGGAQTPLTPEQLQRMGRDLDTMKGSGNQNSSGDFHQF